MTTRKPPPPAPFSLRLSQGERAYLYDKAGTLPLGSYIRSIILENPLPRKKQMSRRTKRPVKDQEQIALILGQLGASRIASNLNQIARAINMGKIVINSETEAHLNDACITLDQIHQKLIKALGYDTRDDT